MGTMAERPEERLIEFLKAKLADDLRAVYRYGDDGHERLWPPDGLTAGPSEDAGLNQYIEAIRRVSAQFGETLSDDSPDADGLVGLVDDQLVVLLPGGQGSCFVVTADRSSDHPMTAFVEACLAAMQ